MTPWPGGCVVHDCQHEALHTYHHSGVRWPACEHHRRAVAQLLGIVNPAKESR